MDLVCKSSAMALYRLGSMLIALEKMRWIHIENLATKHYQSPPQVARLLLKRTRAGVFACSKFPVSNHRIRQTITTHGLHTIQSPVLLPRTCGQDASQQRSHPLKTEHRTTGLVFGDWEEGSALGYLLQYKPTRLSHARPRSGY
jgi:hypothetical protein